VSFAFRNVSGLQKCLRFQNEYNKVEIELRVVQFWTEIKLVITNRTSASRSWDFVITRLISVQIASPLSSITIMTGSSKLLRQNTQSTLVNSHCLLFTDITGPPGPPGGAKCTILKGQTEPLICDEHYVMVRCWGSCGEERMYGKSKCVSTCKYQKRASQYFYALCCEVDSK
jgi:hypothetical protein